MAHLQSQAITLGGGGPALLMDHAQADMDAVASWWYYEGEVPRAVTTGGNREGRESPELGGARQICMHASLARQHVHTMSPCASCLML